MLQGKPERTPCRVSNEMIFIFTPVFRTLYRRLWKMQEKASCGSSPALPQARSPCTPEQAGFASISVHTPRCRLPPSPLSCSLQWFSHTTFLYTANPSLPLSGFISACILGSPTLVEAHLGHPQGGTIYISPALKTHFV